MTMTTSVETFSASDEDRQPNLDQELAGLVTANTPPYHLGDSDTVHAIWERQSVLLGDTERGRRFRGFVGSTRVLRIPNDALPSDLQGTKHDFFVVTDGDRPTGAYKFRGVMSALLEMVEQDDSIREVVATTTGNHGAAVALGATLLGLRSTIYMPEDAVPAKVANTRQYGANVVFAPTFNGAIAAGTAHGKKKGTRFIHPFNDPAVVSGQGTMAGTLADAMTGHDVDLQTTPADLYVGAGGGGLAAGTVVAAAKRLPYTRVTVSQAEGADTLFARLEGREFDAASFNPAVDGAAVLEPGALAIEVLSGKLAPARHVAPRGRIGEAMAVAARFTGIEPAGALGIAAMFAAARADLSGSGIKMAHISGINTTPAKVHQFAGEAYDAGYLTGPEAFALISWSQLDSRRAPNKVEEHGMSLAALQRAVRPVRRGSRVMSGRWG